MRLAELKRGTEVVIHVQVGYRRDGSYAEGLGTVVKTKVKRHMRKRWWNDHERIREDGVLVELDGPQDAHLPTWLPHENVKKYKGKTRVVVHANNLHVGRSIERLKDRRAKRLRELAETQEIHNRLDAALKVIGVGTRRYETIHLDVDEAEELADHFA